jgi:fucose permease
MLALGLAGMLLSLLLCAVAPGVVAFGLAWALFFPASGLACGLAQAALMEADLSKREQRMTEWSLAGFLGDLSTPLMLWAAQEVGLGWRTAFVATAMLLALAAIYLFGQSWPAQLATSLDAKADAPAEAAEPGMLEALRTVFEKRELLVWLAAVALCSLMDEVMTVLVALRVHSSSHSAGLVAQELSAFTGGGLLGLILLRRMLGRIGSTELLAVCALGCVCSYALWLLLDPGWASSMLLTVTGAFAAAHYPIAMAQAYAALPGRATLVAAAVQLFAVFDLILPLVLGWLVDAGGVGLALLALALQPFGLLAVALLMHRSSARPHRR